MDILIFDSLSKKKQKFIPIDVNNVRVYACGPTVYDYAHLGNARMSVVTDLLVRVLRRKFRKVSFVSNITDIDDKIIDTAKKTEVLISDLTKRFHKIYNENMISLNVQPPDIQPKATDYINAMIEMIEKLLENKCAYIAENHVLFEVDSYKYYGKLSKRSIDEQIAGARVEIEDYKKNPRDFVLWKPSNADEPGWPSPWGRGRPGWHIECSAMSEKCLKTPFDIHCGGVDLQFPHHENEIAQSCSSKIKNSKPQDFCKYWFHNGFLTYNGEKMSKSLGNIQLINDILKNYSGEVIRLSLMSAHYRQPLNWTTEILDQSKVTLSRMYKNLARIKEEKIIKIDLDKNTYFKEFLKSLYDDLNTPKAISILNQFFNLIGESSLNDKSKLYQAINEALLILGLKKKTKKFEGSEKINLINKLIYERNIAREIKDFEKADKIREDLKKLNIEIEDTKEGTIWTEEK